MRRPILAAAIGILLFQGMVHAQDKRITLVLKIDKEIAAPAPICVPLSLPEELTRWELLTASEGGAKENLSGQLTVPGVLTDSIKPEDKKLVRRDLHFVLQQKHAPGSTLTLTFTPAPVPDIHVPQFHWQDHKGQYSDLVWDKRPVMRCMYQAYDDSSPDKRNRTYKVFHHLWDPAGQRHVTNVGHIDDPYEVL